MAKALYLLAVLCSLLSQLPAVLDSGFGAALKAVWLLPFLYMLLTAPRSFLGGRLAGFYAFVAVFGYYCFVCQMFADGRYFTADLYNIFVSVLMTAVSFVFWRHHGSAPMLQTVALTIAVGATVLALDVYVEFLRGSDITSQLYAYDDKNSMAPILLFSAMIVLLFYRPRSPQLRWAAWVSAAAMLAVMVMLRSRATLVSALVVVLYYVLRSGNRRVRYWFVALVVVGAFYVLTQASVAEIVLNGILMGGRTSGDVNDLSSGRVFLVLIAVARIPDHLWTGVGDYYVDCMPVNILVQYGILGAVIVFGFLYRLYRRLRRADRTDAVVSAAYVLYLANLANALFEARPPFGPGIRSFMLWMMVGFALAAMDKKKTET